MPPAEYQMIAEGLLPGPDGGLVVAPNTRAQIGMPAQRPGEETLQAIRDLAQQAGAAEVYWFWLAIAGGPSHLALAVHPPEATLIRALGGRHNARVARGPAGQSSARHLPSPKTKSAT